MASGSYVDNLLFPCPRSWGAVALCLGVCMTESCVGGRRDIGAPLEAARKHRLADSSRVQVCACASQQHPHLHECWVTKDRDGLAWGDVLEKCLTLLPLARPWDVSHSFRARGGCPHLHDHAAGSPRPRTSPSTSPHTTWGRGHTTRTLTPQVRASPHGLELLDGTLSEESQHKQRVVHETHTPSRRPGDNKGSCMGVGTMCAALGVTWTGGRGAHQPEPLSRWS